MMKEVTLKEPPVVPNNKQPSIIPGSIIAIEIGKIRGIGKVLKVAGDTVIYSPLSDPSYTKETTLDQVYLLPTWQAIEKELKDLTFTRDMRLGSLQSNLINKGTSKKRKKKGVKSEDGKTGKT